MVMTLPESTKVQWPHERNEYDHDGKYGITKDWHGKWRWSWQKIRNKKNKYRIENGCAKSRGCWGMVKCWSLALVTRRGFSTVISTLCHVSCQFSVYQIPKESSDSLSGSDSQDLCLRPEGDRVGVLSRDGASTEKNRHAIYHPSSLLWRMGKFWPLSLVETLGFPAVISALCYISFQWGDWGKTEFIKTYC